MFLPKKLTGINFSYPKRKIKKANPDVNKEENCVIDQQNLQQESQLINQNFEKTPQEEEDFWVDCKK